MPCSSHAILALDFDGVLCDSATETAITAWRAGASIYPEWTGPRPPPDCIQRFRAIRPILETGFEAIPLMRIAWLDRDCAETPAESLQQRLRDMIRQSNLSTRELQQRFGQTRDQWIHADFPDWLGTHTFYPGAIECLKAAMDTHPVFIVTTKQERFADALLRAQGVELPRNHLYGLERGCSKSEILHGILQRAAPTRRVIHFVEDRLATLRQVAADSRLDAILLYLAAWGYTTAADRQQAAVDPRIRLLAIEDVPLRCAKG